MTIYVNKSGAGMGVDEIEKGTGNGFTFVTDKVTATFPRKTFPNFPAWYYATGLELDESFSYFYRADFTTGSDFTPAYWDSSYWGFFDTDSAWHIPNSLIAVCQTFNNQFRFFLVDSGSTLHQTSTAYTWLANTAYYITVVYNQATNTATAKLYLADDTLLKTLNLTTTGWTWSCDVAGMGNGTGTTNQGQFNNAWDITLVKANSGTTEEFPPDDGDALILTGTLTHNNSNFIMSSSTQHQSIQNSGANDLYRVDNQNTYSGTVTFEHDTDLDGIAFTTGTVTEAANGVTVTLTGYTPALGSVGPFTHDLLEASGRLLETGTGVFVFDHELPLETSLNVYRVLRGSSEVDQLGVDDVYVKKADNRYDREARVYLDEYDGSQADSWKYTQGANTYYYGNPVHIMYHDGTEWKTLWKGYMDNRDSKGNGTTVTIHCVSYDNWLKKRQVDMAFTHRNHTLLEILEQLIKKYTPVEWVAGNIDTDSNPSTLQMTFQGVTVDEAIAQALVESDDEEFGVNNDMEFFVQQRATTHDGTRDAPVSFITNWYDYSFKREGNQQTNRVEVYYGTNLDNMAVSEDRTAQTEMQTELSASQPVVITQKVSRPDIQLLARATSLAGYILNSRTSYWKGTINSYECEDCDPGMITEVTIAEMTELSSATAFKIEVIEYFQNKDETILHMQEPDKIPNWTPTAFAFNNTSMKGLNTNIQLSDTTFDMQSTDWDSQADFNLWGLGANEATHAGGYIYCTGATAGAETCTSPWIVPATGKDAVAFWQDINAISTNNGGTVLVYVEGSVTGVQGPYSDWEDISAVFAKTENTRLSVDITWDGITGVSPTFEFGRIRHK